jgi:hypothetical protein
VVLLYEPDGLVHVQVETPKVGRRVFAALARMREDHPAVASEHIGWGIEPPWLSSSGAYATLLHAEMAPGLIAVRELCADRRRPFRSAWSAYTAGAALCGGDAPGRVPALLLLTPEFVGVARLGGGRAGFKGWVGPLGEAEWAEVRGLLADAGVMSSGAAMASNRRRGGLAVVVAGDPAAQGPFWAELAASGCVETVLGLDDLARAAAGLRPRHPANLIGGFPRAVNLNRGLAATAAVAVGAALICGGLARREGLARVHAREAAAVEMTALNQRLQALSANEREIARLRESGEGEMAGWPRRRWQALTALAAAVPDAVTLTGLRLDARGGFRLEALLLDPTAAVDEFAAALERTGFAFAPGQRLVREAGTGRLTGSGRFETNPR